MTFLALIAAPLARRLASDPDLAQASKNPIALRLQAPRSVASGEAIVVVATVRNVSRAPVTLIRASLPMTELGMACASTFEGPGGLFEPDSVHPMMGQYFRSGGVSPDAFFVLKPGETRELYREAFRRTFADGRPTGDLVERERAARAELAAGRYRVRIDYRLDPHPPVEREDRIFGDAGYPRPTPRSVDPKVRRLLQACWRGSVSVSASFTVVPGT